MREAHTPPYTSVNTTEYQQHKPIGCQGRVLDSQIDGPQEVYRVCILGNSDRVLGESSHWLGASNTT